MSAIEIRPLEPARLADYLRFFDTRAFTDRARDSSSKALVASSEAA
jgi:hypothetical protein